MEEKRLQAIDEVGGDGSHKITAGTHDEMEKGLAKKPYATYTAAASVSSAASSSLNQYAQKITAATQDEMEKGTAKKPAAAFASSAASSSINQYVARGTIESHECMDGLELPAAQTAEAYQDMEKSIRSTVKEAESSHDMLPPIPASQTAARYEEEDMSLDSRDSKSSFMMPPAKSAPYQDPMPPIPDSQTAASCEEMFEERVAKKKTNFTQEGKTPMSEDSLTQPISTVPPATPSIIDEPPLGRLQPSIMLPTRPPPPSMLPSSQDDGNSEMIRAPAPELYHVEATAVPFEVEEPVATPIPNLDAEVAAVVNNNTHNESTEPVYSVVPVPDVIPRSWWNKHSRTIFGVSMGLVIGLIVAIGVSITANNNNNSADNNAVENDDAASVGHPPTSPPSRGMLPPPLLSDPSPVLYLRPTTPPTSASHAPTNGMPIAAEDGASPTSSVADDPASADEPNEPISFSQILWERQGLALVGDAPGDQAGYVALSNDGKIMAVGAPGDTTNEDRPGYVKVYRREPSDDDSDGTSWWWKQLGAKIEGNANGDRFGYSLALSEDGETLVVGAPGYTVRGDRPGYAKVFRVEEDGAYASWKQLGHTIFGEANGDDAGKSVSVSDDGRIVAIGANAYDGNGGQFNNLGHVRVYGWADSDERLDWKQIGEDIDGDAGDNSGISVSLSANGKVVAIGAFFNDANGRNAGRVRVYHMEDADLSWKQLGQDLAGKAALDESGRSASLSADGNTVAIGAWSNDDGGDNSGQVRVYHIMGENTDLMWTQLGQDINGEAAGDRFGRSVSLSKDGKTIAIGANGNDRNGVGSGHVRVYRVVEGDDVLLGWKQLGQSIDGENKNDNSGASVALSSDGKTVVVGSPFNDGNGDKSGHTRVFNIEY